MDLQAPSNSNEAILRTWAIESQPDVNNIERFDNIQLTFTVDYSSARSVTQKDSGVTRDDLRVLLNLRSTSLIHLILSDQSGLDKVSGEALGQRYELDTRELGQQEVSIKTIAAASNAILSRLEASSKRVGSR